MLKKLAPHLLRGQYGEKLAAQYLKKQGLHIVTKNYRTRLGEIDLIAKDKETIVFVEVRLRQAQAPISAAQSITAAKQRKWKAAATQYIQAHYPSFPDCRFDAILITQYPDKKEEIEWLKGLFL
ncbi:YraN family protein [Suttonella ornithocola]|uniref:UPF0102 protein NCTC13337_01118 n=1 Tax=Suttonella ornithocola TaxID=279832 RepID=A0A380MSV2_9GAMM|nr:YraN family protein [Suttonella ornithocola]SUO95136.1 Uncharacterised protein family UPF0102 [Suttonella ornithocola]